MKRKLRANFSTANRPGKRHYVTKTQLEERFALLLLLLQHNFDKLLQRTKTRRK